MDQVVPSTEYNNRLVHVTDFSQSSANWLRQVASHMERKGYMDIHDWNEIIQQISYDDQIRNIYGWWRASNTSSNSSSSSSLQPGQIEVRCIEKNTMTYRFSCPSPPIDAGIFSGTISCG
ncbi:hypothetical protein GAYE_SCF12G3365 [Galdieria yellowstonensis]|uniref:Uncharacterized protein n=1 Tax=Galdieria yellowstonensis TaxID=3028027 RepID=A0AAV9IDJ8_9RHOD|nr:hypothetical protein GAYE_SCF12G3365 [Galdieria yellowstonensis]